MNVHESSAADPLEKDDRARSNFVRELVQCSNKPARAPTAHIATPPRRIVQFWDDLGRLPRDVRECMESWKMLKHSGFELHVFDEGSAREFIRINLGSRYESAFDKCYHPSMKSDYFRYSYIFVKGGLYIDVDDVYRGTTIDNLFTDGRLKLQPFCYDIATGQMVPPSVFVRSGANELSYIFYFNNNPLIAGRGHPLIERALSQATFSLEKDMTNGLPEIQSTTGPGNLTKSIFDAVTESSDIEQTLLVLYDWEDIVKNRWELSYRNGPRNWRLSNGHVYIKSDMLGT